MRIKNKIYLLASLISISVFAQNSNLIAKWNFNGNANDSSGNPNNLAVYNATLTKDRFDNDNSAYYFNGINSYLETIVYMLPSGNSSRTITGWFKSDFDVFGSYQSFDFTLFDYGNILDFQRLSLSLYQKGYLQLTYSADDVPTIYDSSLAYNDQKWHFFAITYNGSKLKTFIDNKIIFDNTINLNTLPNNNLFVIGKQVNDKNYFRGSIDDFAIYNKALTDTEISSLYQSQSLATNENSIAENIKIYPTFINEKIYIDNKKLTKLNIVLFNTAGQKIKKLESNSKKIELNLSEVTKGVYLMEVTDTKSGIKINQKIMKN